MEDENTIIPCQNASELTIVMETLDDLCDKVSNLNSKGTILDGSTTVHSPHFVITSLADESTTDKINDVEPESDKSQSHSVGDGLGSFNNNTGCNNNDSNDQNCDMVESASDVNKAGLTVSMNEIIQKNGEEPCNSGTNLLQDTQVSSKALKNLSECNRTILNGDDGGKNNLLPEGEIFPKVVSMNSPCCSMKDNIKKSEEKYQVMMDVNTCSHNSEGSTGVKYSKISVNGEVKAVLSENPPSENVGIVVSNLDDKNSLVNDLTFVETIAQQELQYLNKLSKDDIVKSQKTLVNEDESSSSDSSSSSTESSSSSDESDSESGNTVNNSTAYKNLDEEDEVDRKAKCLPKTKDEILLSELPPPPPVEIILDENLEIKLLGEIENILRESSLVIIKSYKDVPALDSDSILFLEDRSLFGQVFEIFGQVKNPHYCVRFESEEELRNVYSGQQVYYAPDTTELTNFVFVSKLQSTKGSDASWQYDQEPPEEVLAYSDDETESKAKASKKKLNKMKRNENKVNTCGTGQSYHPTNKRSSSNQQHVNQVLPQAPHPSIFQRPGMDQTGNQYIGEQMQMQNNQLPRLNFQPNNWTPTQLQPRHTYHEHNYYQQPHPRPLCHLPPPGFQHVVPPAHQHVLQPQQRPMQQLPLRPRHQYQSPYHIPPPHTIWHPSQMNLRDQTPGQVHHNLNIPQLRLQNEHYYKH